MRRYQSHKVVEAGVVIRCAPNEAGNQWLVSVEGSPDPFILPASRFEGQSPLDLIGGYLVRYHDGYISWSPRKAFEGGYQLLTPPDAFFDGARELSDSARTPDERMMDAPLTHAQRLASHQKWRHET